MRKVCESLPPARSVAELFVVILYDVERSKFALANEDGISSGTVSNSRPLYVR